MNAIQQGLQDGGLWARTEKLGFSQLCPTVTPSVCLRVCVCGCVLVLRFRGAAVSKHVCVYLKIHIRTCGKISYTLWAREITGSTKVCTKLPGNVCTHSSLKRRQVCPQTGAAALQHLPLKSLLPPAPIEIYKDTGFLRTLYHTFYVIHSSAQIKQWNWPITSTLEHWKIK